MISLNKNAGFTLVEVLVAMVVLAIGLLGLAGLQGVTLKNNQSAYNRSQATQMAYDIVDRMRANQEGEASYLTASAAEPSCLTITGCTSIEMAKNDVSEWQAAITAILPSGVGTIALVAGLYTVTINWDDNRDGDVDGDGGTPEGDIDADGDTDDDPFFQMSFQL